MSEKKRVMQLEPIQRSESPSSRKRRYAALADTMAAIKRKPAGKKKT